MTHRPETSKKDLLNIPFCDDHREKWTLHPKSELFVVMKYSDRDCLLEVEGSIDVDNLNEARLTLTCFEIVICGNPKLRPITTHGDYAALSNLKYHFTWCIVALLKPEIPSSVIHEIRSMKFDSPLFQYRDNHRVYRANFL